MFYVMVAFWPILSIVAGVALGKIFAIPMLLVITVIVFLLFVYQWRNMTRARTGGRRGSGQIGAGLIGLYITFCAICGFAALWFVALLESNIPIIDFLNQLWSSGRLYILK